MREWSEAGVVSRRSLLSGMAACALSGAAGLAAGRAVAAARRGGPELRAREPTRTEAERAKAQPNGVFAVRTDRPLVALTFDDGPDPAYTPAVLETLARFDANASFFVVGVNAAAHPDLLEREISFGHGVGNHTFDHAELELLPAPAVESEIDEGERSIVAAGGPKPRLFRPPKGFTDEVVGVFADAERYRTIFWTVCVERFVDHAGVRPGVQQLLARIRPGMIVLAHDGGHVEAPERPVIDRSRTMEALPLLLEGIRGAGLQPVSVETLLAARPR